MRNSWRFIKKAISAWLEVRKSMNPACDALFITKKGTRITNRAVQEMVKKHIRAAGLDPKRISTHKLKHTAAKQKCNVHRMACSWHISLSIDLRGKIKYTRVCECC